MTTIFRRLSLTLLLTLPLSAQHPRTAAPAGSPVGTWSADHPRNDALELWWNFRPDGTLTLVAGGIARTHYTSAANILTLAAGPSNPAPAVFDIHFTDGKLYTTAHTENPPTMEFTRIGQPPASGSPLIGAWRVTDAPHATDPDQEAIRNRILNLIVVYRPDGTYEARMPVQTFQGRWDLPSHTYTLKDQPALHFERTPAGLTINLPPDGKDSHLYHPDTFPTPPLP